MSTPKNRYIQTVSNFSLKRLFQQLISKVREFFLKAASLAVSDSKSSLDFTQNRWHSLVVENLTAAVIVQDLGGKVLFCNGYAEVLTGYSKREIYGTTNDFLHFIIPYEEDRKRYQRGKTFAKAGEPFQVRYRIKHKAGVEIWAESRTVPIQNKQGEVEAVLSIIFDITASVRYQQLVEEKNRDLYDFAYMVSHDLRSPLSTLKGMVEIINSSKENVEEVKEAVMYISKATQRLDTLISRILDYAKVSSASSNIEEVDLKKVLRDIQDDYAAQIKQINATLEVQGEFLPIKGDPVMLYQVFSNLIGNSIKYRKKGEALRITIEGAPLPQKKLRVSVADNGQGIEKDKLEDIFRPFLRVSSNENDSQGGHGIGLACVKKLIEKMDGSIEVNSTQGVGTEFVLTFKSVLE